MPYKIITAPTAEPLLISDPVVKQALRVIDTAEDAYIAMLLSKAREAAEQLTWRALITQTITLAMDRFPAPGLDTASANWYGPSWGTGPGPLTTAKPDGVTGYEILLPRSPVQAVTGIQYIDPDGALQTLSPSAYLVDTYSEPARITPAVGTAWPGTQNRANAVLVTFAAGYGASGAAVPQGILHWILLVTATLYENREMVAILTRGRAEQLPYVDSLLTNYRVALQSPPAYWA